MRKLSLAAMVAGMVLAVPVTASAVSPKVRGPHAARDAAKPYFDSRTGAKPVAAAGGAERRALRRSLGRQGVVDVDRATGTVRSLQKLDGTLSGPAGGNRSAVAIDWARANSAALGLTAADVDALRLDYRQMTQSTGITHLRYRQAYRGIPAFDNGLRVNLDRAGRILNVTGSPVSGLRVGSIVPKLDAAAALRALQRNVGVERAVKVTSRSSGARRETHFGADSARLVLFTGAKGTRLAWHVTYQATSVALYDAVVDATSGAVLYRQNLVKFAGDATVWPNFPGGELQAPPLDTANAAKSVDLETAGTGPQEWISAGDTQLDGPYSRTYSDVNDDNTPNAGETVARTGGGDFDHPFTQFDEPPNTADENWDDACIFSDSIEPAWPDPLSPGVLCSWDPTDRRRGRTTAPRTACRRSTSSTSSATTSPAPRSASPTTRTASAATARASRTTRCSPRPTTAPTAPATAARTATTSTTRTCRRRPTAPARGCRCTCSASTRTRTRSSRSGT